MRTRRIAFVLFASVFVAWGTSSTSSAQLSDLLGQFDGILSNLDLTADQISAISNILVSAKSDASTLGQKAIDSETLLYTNVWTKPSKAKPGAAAFSKSIGDLVTYGVNLFIQIRAKLNSDQQAQIAGLVSSVLSDPTSVTNLLGGAVDLSQLTSVFSNLTLTATQQAKLGKILQQALKTDMKAYSATSIAIQKVTTDFSQTTLDDKTIQRDGKKLGQSTAKLVNLVLGQLVSAAGVLTPDQLAQLKLAADPLQQQLLDAWDMLKTGN